MPCSTASTVLMNPAMPAAGPRWPMLVLTEPRPHQPASSVPAPSTLDSAATSIGSPSEVPVPCASTYVTVRGSIWATPSACETAAAWPSALGAEKPILVAPSLLIALPITTARMWSPSATASDSRFSTAMPPPPPQIVPAAEASNARQCPSGE